MPSMCAQSLPWWQHDKPNAKPINANTNVIVIAPAANVITAGVYKHVIVKHNADANKPTNNNVSLTNIKNIKPVFKPAPNVIAATSAMFSLNTNINITDNITCIENDNNCDTSAKNAKQMIKNDDKNNDTVVPDIATIGLLIANDLKHAVATKFIDDNVVEKPITVMPKIVIVIPYTANNVPAVDNGGYNVQPKPVTTSHKCANNTNNNELTQITQLKLFNFAQPTSGEQINNGTNKLPKWPNKIGIAKPKIINKP